MTRRVPLPAVVAVASLVAAAVSASGLPAPLRAPAAVTLLLWLPGLAISRALLTPRRRDRAGSFAMLALGLSLSVGTIAAVELAAFRHLTGPNWAAVVGAVSVGACALWHVRSRSAPAPNRPAWPRSLPVPGALFVLLSVALVAGAVVSARTPRPVPADRGYTVLAVTDVRPDGRAATVTVTSEEAGVERSVLLARAGDRTLGRVVVDLHPGAVFEYVVPVPRGLTGQVLITLTKARETTPYRRVSLQFPQLFPWPATSEPPRA